MSQNPKKPVITELDDADVGLCLSEDLDFDLGLDDPEFTDDEIFTYDGIDGLSFDSDETPCLVCERTGIVYPDDCPEGEDCPECNGTGYLIVLG